MDYTSGYRTIVVIVPVLMWFLITRSETHYYGCSALTREGEKHEETKTILGNSSITSAFWVGIQGPGPHPVVWSGGANIQGPGPKPNRHRFRIMFSRDPVRMFRHGFCSGNYINPTTIHPGLRDPEFKTQIEDYVQEPRPNIHGSMILFRSPDPTGVDPASREPDQSKKVQIRILVKGSRLTRHRSRILVWTSRP